MGHCCVPRRRSTNAHSSIVKKTRGERKRRFIQGRSALAMVGIQELSRVFAVVIALQFRGEKKRKRERGVGERVRTGRYMTRVVNACKW